MPHLPNMAPLISVRWVVPACHDRRLSHTIVLIAIRAVQLVAELLRSGPPKIHQLPNTFKSVSYAHFQHITVRHSPRYCALHGTACHHAFLSSRLSGPT